jgi:hypothetical protein
MGYKLPSPVAASDGGTGVSSVSTTPGVSLISNGTGNQYFNPFQGTYLFDDFITGAQTSELGWNIIQGTFGSFTIGTTTDAGHPGNMQLSSSNIASSGGTISLSLSNTTGTVILGSGAIDLYWVVQLPTLSNSTNRYAYVVGFGTSAANTAVPYFQNGVYFSYSDSVNSGNWQLIATKAGVSTTTNTATVVGTTYTTLHININAAGTTATFYINGVSVGTVASNLPVVSVAPAAYIQKSIGSAATSSANHDMVYMYQSLTSPR